MITLLIALSAFLLGSTVVMFLFNLVFAVKKNVKIAMLIMFLAAVTFYIASKV